MNALLIFPHQLFESNAQLANMVERVYIIEDSLYFLQYRFHKQKLVLHRASMQAHADYLRSHGIMVEYVGFAEFPTLLALFKQLVEGGTDGVHYIDVIDDWLERGLQKASAECRIPLIRHTSSMFLTEGRLLKARFCKGGDSRMARFYMDQRRQQDILMNAGSPVGGRWSFDQDNRKRLPKGYSVPTSPKVPANKFVDEAQRYVSANFAENPGSVEPFTYPVTYEDAGSWLNEFLDHRLSEFGDYEDAISQKHDVLFHSVLTPSLNIGLLTPRRVVDAALVHQDRVPINSLEGFIRQIIGWREYMRGVYESKGSSQRTRNHWNHAKPIPSGFYTGNTSIAPLDMVIKKLLRCAYAHHIERLMLLGNFMLLCEFHPDAVYRWFMEMFIDSYDWVMVPNVYGMALYADGGSITTKPYISGSNYVLKMSDFAKGPWCAIWDGLYWRFVAKHRQEFKINPRTQVLVQGLDRMSSAKRSSHLEIAENFLQGLAG